MIVRALAANPACRFYEALGARLLSEGVHMMDEQPLSRALLRMGRHSTTEVTVRWSNIDGVMA